MTITELRYKRLVISNTTKIRRRRRNSQEYEELALIDIKINLERVKEHQSN